MNYKTNLKLYPEPTLNKGVITTPFIPFVGKYAWYQSSGKIFLEYSNMNSENRWIGNSNDRKEVEDMINSDFKKIVDSFVSYTDIFTKEELPITFYDNLR
jgi:hypothetical protein